MVVFELMSIHEDKEVMQEKSGGCVKKLAAVALTVLAGFSIPAFAQQNTILEETEQNCRLIRSLSTSSYDGLIKAYKRPRNEFEFVRSRWDRGACNILVDTPQGATTCFVTGILKGPAGNVFAVISSPVSGQVNCF